jgi:hypothetical protein
MTRVVLIMPPRLRRPEVPGTRTEASIPRIAGIGHRAKDQTVIRVFSVSSC